MGFSTFFKNKRIAVTGAAGTIGKDLVRQLLLLPLKEVRALDNNESALFFLGESYRRQPRLQVFLADVRDYDKMEFILKGVDFVFHAAALKHVPLCEQSPFDAVQTNINGVQNIIKASIANGVRKVIFTSSDKAVNPTNVMGTTKLMGERLVTAANALGLDNDSACLASTRFGNVAGSQGSVIPLFTQQIQQGGPVTLTSPGMSRFMMTLDAAVALVINSMCLAKGGEVFVPKMPVIRIKDLAAAMIELLAPLYGFKPECIEIRETGLRPGEKLYEELMNDEEKRRSYESKNYFIILPALTNIYSEIEYSYKGLQLVPVEHTYNSANVPHLQQDEIQRFLFCENVFHDTLRVELLNKCKAVAKRRGKS